MAMASQASAKPARAAGPSEPVARLDNPAGRSPVLLICEHASNRLPERYGTLGLDAAALQSHIAWDPGALGVAQGLARLLDAPLIHATVSRLVLDLNREPSAEDSITTLSERTAVPGNEGLGPDERARRVRDVYDAFHKAVDAFVATRPPAMPLKAVISVHSFTPVYRDVARPWHVGLIHEADRRMALSVEAGLKADPALVVGMNEPYSPADRVFHTLDRHAVRRGLAPLMIEIRNDLIRSPQDQESWAGRLAPLIAQALGAV
ncbi:MAG TPA: N-formylglutamate amidohydrolase [Microvirga sp.]|jgi:predicted N-formylglutamate amidohydrolase